MKDPREIPIGELLWQQPPFRFVDQLEFFSEEKSVVSFTPGEGNLLMENDGCLSAAGLLEHMAQSQAARSGYYCKYVLQVPVTIGFIGQVRDYRINRLPRAGEKLTTTVYLKYEMFKVCLCDLEVRSGEELLATGTLKTAEKND